MKLKEEQLRHIIDEHVEKTLNEWFGSQLWNTAKNFGQSDFVRNVGNTISNGYGDRINSFAKGDWKGARKMPTKKETIEQYFKYCKKSGIEPKEESSLEKFLNDTD